MGQFSACSQCISRQTNLLSPDQFLRCIIFSSRRHSFRQARSSFVSCSLHVQHVVETASLNQKVMLFSLMLVTDSILCLGAASPTPQCVTMKTSLHHSGLKGWRWFCATQAKLQIWTTSLWSIAANSVLFKELFIILVFSELTRLIRTTHTIFYLCNGLFINMSWEFDLIIQTTVCLRCVKIQFHLATQPFLSLLHFQCTFHYVAN